MPFNPAPKPAFTEAAEKELERGLAGFWIKEHDPSNTLVIPFDVRFKMHVERHIIEALKNLSRIDTYELAKLACQFFPLNSLAIPEVIQEHVKAYGQWCRDLLLEPSFNPDTALGHLDPEAYEYIVVLFRNRCITSSDAVAVHLARYCTMQWLNTQ